METWYFSPLPKELVGPTGFMEVLYVCEFTLRLFARKAELQRHQSRLPVHARHPPGNEVYRCGNIAMFEVDGLEEKIYSQNLCYLAKLFLDHSKSQGKQPPFSDSMPSYPRSFPVPSTQKLFTLMSIPFYSTSCVKWMIVAFIPSDTTPRKSTRTWATTWPVS